MFKIGCDAEFFGKKNGRHVSLIGRVGGTKADPRKTKHGAVQEDNVAAEINTIPASTEDELVSNVAAVIEDLKEIVEPQEIEIDTTSASAMFDDSELEHPDAKRFGCDPDFDAWLAEMREMPTDVPPNLRTCGGHIHFGYKFKDGVNAILDFVKWCDVFLALPAVAAGVEDATRKKLYGQAGTFRVKPYGVEYRTLSNFWLSNPEYVKWVFQQAKVLFEMRNRTFTMEYHPVRAIINSGNMKEAEQWCRMYNILLPTQYKEGNKAVNRKEKQATTPDTVDMFIARHRMNQEARQQREQMFRMPTYEIPAYEQVVMRTAEPVLEPTATEIDWRNNPFFTERDEEDHF